MRRYAVSLLLLCFLAVPVAAQGTLPGVETIAETLEWKTISGVVGFAWVITEYLVSFVAFLGVDQQRKKLTALVVAVLVGVVVKVTGQGFIEMDLMTLVFSLVVAVAGLKVFHSLVGGPVVDTFRKKKATP